MSFRLPNSGYSQNERRLFALLSKRPVSSTDIMHAYYGGVRKVPWNGRVRMMNVMRSLMRKMAHNKESVTIVHSPRAGPNPVDFRIIPSQNTVKLSANKRKESLPRHSHLE